MDNGKKRILLVDDNQEFVESTQDILKLSGYDVDYSLSVNHAKAKLREQHYTHLLLDLMLPDGSGINVLEELPLERLESTSITIMTGHPAVKQIAKSFVGPSVNYLIKPVTFKQLKAALEEPTQGTDISNDASAKPSLFIGESVAMQELKATIDLVAASDANVMLMGESGVGKEVVAKAIHGKSRLPGLMVSMNCGAISKELITSELFGHEKGAFTGAIGKKIGVFERANNGTLFLDEITEMPLESQSNLLRALETQTINRVGGDETIAARCRVISASNRSEAELAKKQYLREDLYFRLAVFPIKIPPLRERKGDIPLLAAHFIKSLKGGSQTLPVLTPADIDRLEAYPWPGNVRELKHVIHRALILTPPQQQKLSLPETFSSPFTQSTEDTLEGRIVAGRSLEDMEKELIQMTLAAYNGDKTKTAKILGISTKTLYNRLNAYQNK